MVSPLPSVRNQAALLLLYQTGEIMSSLSIGYSHHQSFTDRFKKLDTDNDGKISKDEFIAGAPKGTDSTQASNLYDQLVQAASSSSSSTASSSSTSSTDSTSTGLSASDLQTAFQSLSGSTRSAMFQMQASGQYGPPPPPPSDDDSSSTDQTDGTDGSTSTSSTSDTASSRFHNFFAKLDADGDGKVSKDEFVAAAPPGMDATKAGDFYDQLAKAAASSNASSSSDTTTATSDTSVDGLSESDLKTAFDSLRPQGPRLAQASDQSQTTQQSVNDLLKHISDDLDQILTASNTSSTSSTSSTSGTSSSASSSAASTTVASSSDSSADTDSSSTDQNSTTIADELSVISKQLEKLLAARKSYGMANASFAPFMGSTTQAAA